MNFKSLRLKRHPKTALVIANPGLGDALFSTPLVKSLHATYPGIKVDMLVREPAVGILKNIPEIRNVLCFNHKSIIRSYLSMVKKILRKYDLAISTSDSDRSTLACFYAAPVRIGKVPFPRPQDWWKRLILQGWIVRDKKRHILTENLLLEDVLGLKKNHDVLLPGNFNLEKIQSTIGFEPEKISYAVIHCFPSLANKMWPLQHWQKVIEYLITQGLKIVLTGGNSQAELAFSSSLQSKYPDYIYLAVAKLNFSNLIKVIEKSQLYIGVDTSVSHLAAFLNKPTICLFGPSNVVRWSPWPNNYDLSEPPFSKQTGTQQIGNVCIIQGECSCGIFPAKCSQNTDQGNSSCMASILPQQVIQACNFLCNASVTDILPFFKEQHASRD